jgi:hypothetical protein
MVSVFCMVLLAAASCGPPMAEVVVRTPPPAERVEVVGVAPYAGAVWIGGHWRWSGRGHVWMPGYWQRPRIGHVWEPAHWVDGPAGWRFVPGHWRRV